MKPSPKATAMASAWSTSASASARRPAPSARAIADEMPPPMAPADIICISITRKNQRHTGQGVGPELADKIGLDQPDRSLHDHHQHVRRCEPQQGPRDRCFEQQAGAWVEPGAYGA